MESRLARDYIRALSESSSTGSARYSVRRIAGFGTSSNLKTCRRRAMLLSSYRPNIMQPGLATMQFAYRVEQVEVFIGYVFQSFAKLQGRRLVQGSKRALEFRACGKRLRSDFVAKDIPISAFSRHDVPLSG